MADRLGYTEAVLSRAIAFLLLASCAAPTMPATLPNPPPRIVEWALVIHGGAGTQTANDDAGARLDGLRTALARGSDILAKGGTSLDAVEAAVRMLEDNPFFNAGRGAVFNAAGHHPLDASIMDGANLNAGGVANVETARHPITLARHVMTGTLHLLLAGAGAEAFADDLGDTIERVDNHWFSTEHRRQQWLQRRNASRGTVGAVARDLHGNPNSNASKTIHVARLRCLLRCLLMYHNVHCCHAPRLRLVSLVARNLHGNLAAATSTGGLTDKKYGRVGDSPIIGAGTYADNQGAADVQ